MTMEKIFEEWRREKGWCDLKREEKTEWPAYPKDF